MCGVFPKEGIGPTLKTDAGGLLLDQKSGVRRSHVRFVKSPRDASEGEVMELFSSVLAPSSSVLRPQRGTGPLLFGVQA